jgi:predicted transcriptional regulator
MKTMIKNMFTKTETVTDLKEIKTQTASKYLNKNLEKAYEIATKYVKENNYRITYSSNETSKILFEKLKSSNLSHNRSKKIAKQIFYIIAEPSIKKINRLMHLVYKTNETKSKYKITKSNKELEIQSKRRVWKELRDQAEKARLEYVEEKGDFYKTK